MPLPDQKRGKERLKEKEKLGTTKQSKERRLHVTNACPVLKPNVAIKYTNLKTMKSQ